MTVCVKGITVMTVCVQVITVIAACVKYVRVMAVCVLTLLCQCQSCVKTIMPF